MNVAELQCARDLQAESARLKKLLAEAHLDIDALKVASGVKREPRRPNGRSSASC